MDEPTKSARGTMAERLETATDDEDPETDPRTTRTATTWHPNIRHSPRHAGRPGP